MARLAEYMADLAELLGYKRSVHFVGLEPGSTEILHRIESEDVQKVERRLRDLDRHEAPPDVVKAFKSLDARLASDNAIGTLKGLESARGINFPGRERPKPLEYGAFRQQATLQGVLIRIGGRPFFDLRDWETPPSGDVGNTFSLCGRKFNALEGVPRAVRCRPTCII